MCGIIGYIGKQTEHNLIEGLKKLEYRGYDSAGLCIQRDGDFYVEKTIGSVEKLESKTKQKEQFGVGISHTRWATHGKINVFNAHPHFSSKANISLVHNGIIENFESLKNEMVKRGVYFYGDTDSEVICKLFGNRLDIKTLKKVLGRLQGSYALAIISKKENAIYFAKNMSPLYVSIDREKVMVSSDPSCFLGLTHEYYSLDDGDYGKVSLDGCLFFNKNHKKIIKKTIKINFNYQNENKNNFNHYMLKEINESKKTIKKIIKKYSQKNITQILESIKKLDFNRVYIIGCGTAYHAGLVGKNYLSNIKNFDVFCDYASEIHNQKYIVDNRSLAIFISQSGETSDTICALEYMKKMGAKTLTITNVEYSTLAQKSDFVLPICAGQERAVASTKAYIGQIIVMFILARIIQGKKYNLFLKKLSKNLDYCDDEIVKKVAKVLSAKKEIFIIGRGLDFVTALEASLKIKEISYINTTAIPSGELKHGPLALIENGSSVICVASDKKLLSKTLNNAYETKSRGAEIMLVTCLDIDEKIKNNFNYIFQIKNKLKIQNKKLKNIFKPIQMIIFFQKLAYYISVEKNLNPDKPRNLAKSVTVA